MAGEVGAGGRGTGVKLNAAQTPCHKCMHKFSHSMMADSEHLQNRDAELSDANTDGPHAATSSKKWLLPGQDPAEIFFCTLSLSCTMTIIPCGARRTRGGRGTSGH